MMDAWKDVLNETLFGHHISLFGQLMAGSDLRFWCCALRGHNQWDFPSARERRTAAPPLPRRW